MRFYTGQHQYYCLPDVRQAGSTCPKGIPSGKAIHRAKTKNSLSR